MAATAADIPTKFDVVINGVGYVNDRTQEVRSQFGYTPTFVPRTNVEGDFGDNRQEFWLTATQRDWTYGEEQRFFRATDPHASRYWTGEAVDIGVPGSVRLAPAATAVTLGATPVSGTGGDVLVYYCSSTNLYTMNADGTETDRGAHGLGVSPTAVDGMVFDGSDLYITNAGASGVVRRWDGASFTSFSTTQDANALEFLNNTLYGCGPSGKVFRYDTAGVATTLYQFKSADGGLGYPYPYILRAFGGKLLIVTAVSSLLSGSCEVWIFDGVGVARVLATPPNFAISSIIVQGGAVFIGGGFKVGTGANVRLRPAVYVYTGGNLEMLWRSPSIPSDSTVALAHVAPLGADVLIYDRLGGKLLTYNPRTGGVSTLAANATATAKLLACATFVLQLPSGGTGAYRFPNSASYASSGSVTTSLIDFDSSLTKIMRGIKVEFESGSDGNGGSVDIAYRVGDVDGSYTTLQTGAVSGTEYTLTNITGRSISVKVTLNKGTSTLGPVLKRVNVRAVPQQAAFRQATYALDCTGRDGTEPVMCLDGSPMPLDGKAMADNLRTAASNATPVPIIDEFGPYTGVITEGFRLDKVRPHEYRALVPAREV